MKTRVIAKVVIGCLALIGLQLSAPVTATAGTTTAGYEVVTVVVTSAGSPTVTSRAVRAAGPGGENLLCDKVHAFTDEGGEFTLQHQCGGTTAPWGYRVAPPLRAIAVTPVSERGVDWTRNGIRQPRMAPHVEAADYVFHGTFPHSPDGTTITYEDSYSFRHGMGSGGDVTISVKGAFTLTGVRG